VWTMKEASSWGKSCVAVACLFSATIISGCGGGASGGDSDSGTCSWNLNGFKKSGNAWGGARASISGDGQEVTCPADGDACIVFGDVIPWTNPWKEVCEGKPCGEEKCPGTYTYTIHITDCGSQSEGSTPGWDDRVGFVAGSSVQTYDLGSNLWVDGNSCYDSGWTCGCMGTLGDGTEAIVTGDITLKVTVNTATWKISIEKDPPAGAKAKHSDSPTSRPEDQPVKAHTMIADLAPVESEADEIRPSFLLNAGATFVIGSAYAVHEATEKVVV